MFKLQRIFAKCFPGHLGIQPFATLDKADQSIRDFITSLPPELALPPNYTPAPTESAVEIIRRYSIAAEIQGSIMNLHRSYISKSGAARDAVIAAAWTLFHYQAQIMALSDILEPFHWYIEEYMDPHLFRGCATLGFTCLREPDNPNIPAIFARAQICSQLSKEKILRKSDYAKIYGIFRAMQIELVDRYPHLVAAPVVSDLRSGSTTTSSLENSPGRGAFWDMQDVLVDPMFKWDSYLVDMVLDTELPPV
jgi:hypothetical protein